MAAWTQANADALRAAIAGGAVVQSMAFGETTITFRSLDDMLKLLALMEQSLGTAPRTRYGATRKGA